MTAALITGITGMVGSRLVDYLLDKTDWDIYGLVRWNDKMDNGCISIRNGEMSNYVCPSNTPLQSRAFLPFFGLPK